MTKELADQLISLKRDIMRHRDYLWGHDIPHPTTPDTEHLHKILKTSTDELDAILETFNKAMEAIDNEMVKKV